MQVGLHGKNDDVLPYFGFLHLVPHKTKPHHMAPTTRHLHLYPAPCLCTPAAMRRCCRRPKQQAQPPLLSLSAAQKQLAALGVDSKSYTSKADVNELRAHVARVSPCWKPNPQGSHHVRVHPCIALHHVSGFRTVTSSRLQRIPDCVGHSLWVCVGGVGCLLSLLNVCCQGESI